MKHLEDKFIWRENKAIFNWIWNWELGLIPNGFHGIWEVMQMFQNEVAVMVVQPHEFT